MQNDSNRHDGSKACYIKNKICYNRNAHISDNIGNILTNLWFPKTKPVSLGILYKPSTQTKFLEQLITEFEATDINNDIYILG